MALAATGPELAPMDAAVREWNIAREVDARINVHVGFGLLGKRGLLQAPAGRVALANDTTYRPTWRRPASGSAGLRLRCGGGHAVAVSDRLERELNRLRPRDYEREWLRAIG